MLLATAGGRGWYRVPRSATGTIETRGLVDGTRAFHLRFYTASGRELVVLHERPRCECGCGGGWSETTARTELAGIQARVRAGVWERPDPSGQAKPGAILEAAFFEEYAWWWLSAKVEGVIGAKPINENTAKDYRWRLKCHLVPFFGQYRLDEINGALCQRFKTQKLREAAEQRDRIGAGVVPRDERGRRVVPLRSASLRKLMDALAAILEDAMEDGHLLRNPARARRMRVHVPKPKRCFLETDELASLFDAAAQQDHASYPVAASGLGDTAALVAQLLSKDKQPKRIAEELGLAPSTVTYHLRRLGAQAGRGYAGWRAVVEILGRTGVRSSELCDLRIGQVRLHNPNAARFYIQDSKTETGIREVQMSPHLVEAVIEHLQRLRRVGAPTGPEDYLIPNLNGGRLSRQRVAEIVRKAALLATERRALEGLPPLPHTTPHTLRRTYISIALLANNFDVKWVMSQVGHADSRMTLDVYAQLAQRVDRRHGTNFDRLVEISRHTPRLGDEKATSHRKRSSSTNKDATITIRKAYAFSCRLP